MKHVTARLASTCVACSTAIVPGDKVVLMRGADFRRDGFPESWRGCWIHKACKIKHQRREQ